MRLHGLGSDHSRKFALASHAFSQRLAECFAKVRVLESLDIIVNVIGDIARFMSHYDNALGLGLLDYRLERLWIIRNHNNSVHVLRDEVRYHLHLFCGIA